MSDSDESLANPGMLITLLVVSYGGAFFLIWAPMYAWLDMPDLGLDLALAAGSGLVGVAVYEELVDRSG
jgi:nitrate/nitrite transporter NarK